MTSGCRVVMYSCELVNVTEMARTEGNMWRMACNYALSNQITFIAVLWHTALIKHNEISLTNLYIIIYVMVFKRF